MSRDYVHIIQGQEVRIPRGKPTLSADAVPTILPNLPTYLTKKLPKERVSRKRKRSETSDELSSCSGGRGLFDSLDDSGSGDKSACCDSGVVSTGTQASTINVLKPTTGLPAHDHNEHVARSDSRIIFHVAGYIARKCVLKMKCEGCVKLLTMPPPGEGFQLARLTHFCDRGGLLYPSSQLFGFVRKLENLFTECFSRNELHSASVLDMLEVVKGQLTVEVGCPEHISCLTAKIISFYITTRLHFYVKGINSDNAGKRQKAKHLKLSRCS